jgi:hypothetical protein
MFSCPALGFGIARPRAGVLMLVGSVFTAWLAAADSDVGSGGTIPIAPAAASLRELATDRPDVTESPFTIDRGHGQLEMDLANTTRNRRDGDRTTTWELAPFNVRLGVTENFELGVFAGPYVRQVEEPRGGPKDRRTGLDDVVLRAKYNFWGNNGGDSAGGIIADLLLPAGTHGLGSGKTGAGVRLPFALTLPGGWDLGLMTGGDWIRHDADGRRARWINTATLGHDLTRTLSAYTELTSDAGRGPQVATFDLGMAWQANPNLQWDAGVNLGISRAADDLQVFAGVSRRY